MLLSDWEPESLGGQRGETGLSRTSTQAEDRVEQCRGLTCGGAAGCCGLCGGCGRETGSGRMSRRCWTMDSSEKRCFCSGPVCVRRPCLWTLPPRCCRHGPRRPTPSGMQQPPIATASPSVCRKNKQIKVLSLRDALSSQNLLETNQHHI